MTPREVLAILRGLAGIRVGGGDVVEVAPHYDATTNTAQVAAQVLFTELCLAARDPGFSPRAPGVGDTVAVSAARGRRPRRRGSASDASPFHRT